MIGPCHMLICLYSRRCWGNWPASVSSPPQALPSALVHHENAKVGNQTASPMSLPSSSWWRPVLSSKWACTQGRASAWALVSFFLLLIRPATFLKIGTIRMQTIAPKTGIRKNMAERRTLNGGVHTSHSPVFKQTEPEWVRPGHVANKVNSDSARTLPRSKDHSRVLRAVLGVR